MGKGAISSLLKVLIIGVDGATLNLVKPWAETGKLPNFRRLIEEGVHGELRSTYPPLTAAAWTSFMCGKNPGKHGLYDFVEPRPGSYEVRYTNARSRLAKTLWQILNESGMRVGVINVPMTYPPDPVNGFMISGLDAPEGSRGVTHPPELYDELEGKFGKVTEINRYLGYLNSDERRRALLKALEDMEDHYLAMTEYLLEKHPVDAAMVVFTSTDAVQHFFWHYMDARHPQYDPAGAEQFGDAILGVYRKIDEVIGKLVSRLPEGASCLLMSDHGFMPTSTRVVYVNHYLAEIGVLRLREDNKKWYRSGPLLHELIKRGDLFLRSALSPQQKGKMARWFPKLREKWESHQSGLSLIDWKRTKAYCNEVISCPSGIWVNLQGIRPQGIVEPGAQYEELLRFLTEKLRTLKDPLTGQPLIHRVYRKEEIYHGPCLDQAPDLTIAWWEGITFVSKPSFSKVGKGVAAEYRGRGPLAGGEWSGTHALQGMCLMQGGPFQKDKLLEGVEIIDLAPTLLYLLGLPIPEDMDGRLLREAFLEDFVAAHPSAVGKDEGRSHAEFREETYSDEEALKMEERLRNLGYIE